MKIGDEGIHGTEAVAWPDEEVDMGRERGGPLPRAGGGVVRVKTLHAGRCPFEGTHRGGADRHNASSLQGRVIDAARHIAGEFCPFGVNRMLLQFFNTHRLKSVQPNMKRHGVEGDSPAAQGDQKFGCDVKPRGGCGDTSHVPAIDGLIAFTVACIGSDIGRQRNLAQLVETIPEWNAEANPADTTRFDPDNSRYDAAAVSVIP